MKPAFPSRELMLVVLLLACAFPVNSHLGKAQGEQTRIRVNVDRVNVGVIVTDARGNFVEGLGRENFHVLDNGVEQPLTDFAAVAEPAQVLLLIEAGPAVYLLEGGHLQAAQALLNGLSREDRVAVVKYAESPEALLEFTTDKQAAAAALDQLQFNLGYGSLNLSVSVARVLAWLGQVPGKKSIVLLSTGLDTSSSKDSVAVRQQLETSDVLLMAVSLTGGLENPGPGSKKKKSAPQSTQTAAQFAQASQLLREMAESTGGRAYFPSNASELNAAFAEIAQIARHEYSLAFAPPSRDGLLHSIGVRVDARESAASKLGATPCRIDHRRAYLAVAATGRE